jgi:hypothetical protein
MQWDIVVQVAHPLQEAAIACPTYLTQALLTPILLIPTIIFQLAVPHLIHGSLTCTVLGQSMLKIQVSLPPSFSKPGRFKWLMIS